MPMGYAALYNHLRCMHVIIFQMKQHRHKKWGAIGVSAGMADGYPESGILYPVPSLDSRHNQYYAVY